jgi:hypothetical protein
MTHVPDRVPAVVAFAQQKPVPARGFQIAGPNAFDGKLKAA